MTINGASILDGVVSHGLAAGLFERVNTHEPKSAPGNGLSAAVWVDRIEPVRSSGLASTSGRFTLMMRVYSSMTQEPEDAIDPNILAAVDVLMTAYSGDFTLGGQIRNVDLVGTNGVGLSAQAGYIQQDGKLYRVMTITIPLICNDLWVQEA